PYTLRGRDGGRHRRVHRAGPHRDLPGVHARAVRVLPAGDDPRRRLQPGLEGRLRPRLLLPPRQEEEPMAEVALNVLLTIGLASVSVWVTISARRSFGWPGGSPGPAPPPPAC